MEECGKALEAVQNETSTLGLEHQILAEEVGSAEVERQEGGHSVGEDEDQETQGIGEEQEEVSCIQGDQSQIPC
jgi:hypothetical protein